MFDHNHTLVLDDLGFHLLLLGGFQIAVLLSLFAHALHGIHHIALLRQKRVAQVSGPLDIVCKAFDYIGQSGHRLNARIPRLFCHSVGQSLVFQTRVFQKPLLKLDEF